MGTAQVQGALWGARAREWADLQEHAFGPMSEAAFDVAGVGAATNLLDVGCGAGLALSIARGRGATVSGIDAASELVEITTSPVAPAATFASGNWKSCPSPMAALTSSPASTRFSTPLTVSMNSRRPDRVVKPGGKVVALVWGEADKCELAGYLGALGSLLPPPPLGAPGPWALSPSGALEDLAAKAGLRTIAAQTVVTSMRFDNEQSTMRASWPPVPRCALSKSPVRRRSL